MISWKIIGLHLPNLNSTGHVYIKVHGDFLILLYYRTVLSPFDKFIYCIVLQVYVQKIYTEVGIYRIIAKVSFPRFLNYTFIAGRFVALLHSDRLLNYIKID